MLPPFSKLLQLLVVVALSSTYLRLVVESSIDYNINLLYSKNSPSSNTTIKKLISSESVFHGSNGCLTNVQKQAHSFNDWIHTGKNKLPSLYNYLSGSTFWINEWQTPGHAMLDMVVIQVLQSIKLDRIILQRTPLPDQDVYAYWNTFFKAYYAAMIDAFQPGIPIYIRREQKTDILKAYYLSLEPNSTSPLLDGFVLRQTVMDDDTIVLNKDKQCFENVYTRGKLVSGGAKGLEEAVSPSAAQQFKRSAHKLIMNIENPRDPTTTTNVILAYRANTIRRNIPNMNVLLETAFSKDIGSSSSSPILHFRSVPIPGHSFEQQMRLVYDADVLVTVHGAFQGNTVYMRNGSLLIELRGSYSRGQENVNPFYGFRCMARAFGVFHQVVFVDDLNDHDKFNSSMTNQEAMQIYNLVKDYATNIRPLLLTKLLPLPNV